MKHLLKRTLALILSVLMVLGTLPTTAWAARMTDDEAQEIPVLDPEDRVVDTLRKEEDGETPEQPTDPENPVDPAWNDMTVESVEVKSDGTWEVVVSRPSAIQSNTGAWGLVLAPNVRKAPGAGEDTFLPSTLKGQFAGANVVADMEETLAQAALPAGSYLVVGTTDSLSFTDAANGKTYLTLTSGDWGKLPTMETLRTDLVGYWKETGAVAATDTTLPFYAVFFSKQDPVGVADKTTDMVWENTTFELVADPTSIDSTGISSLDFALKNADSAGVPSVVDKITFTGTLSDGTEYTKVFDGTYNGMINMSPDPFTTDVKSISQGTGEVGKDFESAQGYITVEYHKNGDPSAKKTLTIQVIPKKPGEIWATPIVISIKAGDPAKTGSTIISNGRGTAIAILTAEDATNYTDDGAGNSGFAGTPTESCVPASVPGGLTVTEGTIPYGNINEDCDTITSGLIASGDTLEIKDIITVEAPKGVAQKGTWDFQLSLNRINDGDGYDGAPLYVDVTVIVEVDQEWTVTFHENYDSDTTHDVTVADGANVAPYNVTRSGWTLEGWYYDQKCTNKVSFPYKPTADIDFYAKWSQDLSTVTFDANGGTVADNKLLSQSGVPGGAVTDPAPTRAGYSLDGWVKDGETTPVAIGAIKFPAAGTTDKYTAQWSQITHTVTYDFGTVAGAVMAPHGVTLPTQGAVAEGGTFNVSTALNTSTVYTNGSATGLGYNFTGWAVTGITGTTSADPNDTLTMGTSNITLTAQWAPKNYTVTYVKGANGPAAATIANDSKQVQHGAKHTVGTDGGTAVTGVTDGWQFKSWDRSGELTITADTTITANWQVRVTFDKNGGDSGDSTAWVDHGGKATEPATDPARTGWIFGGWYDAATSGNEVDFTAKTFSAPTTLYAHWTQGQSKIKYNWNYTGGSTVEHEGDTGATDTPPTPAPSRTGYTWDGKWYTTAACTTAVTTFTFPATVGGEVTYYAKWTAQYAYQLVYNANNGTGGPAAVTVDWSDNASHTFTLDFTAANMPTRANYTFLGWADSSTATTPDYTSTGTKTVAVTGTGHTQVTKTVYAVWSRDQSSVKFQVGATGASWSSGGTGSGDITKTGDTGTTVGTANVPSPTRTGYTFAQWKKDNTGNTVNGSAITYPATKDATDTYVAQWTPETRTVTFNRNWTSTDSTAVATWTRNYDGTVLGAETALPTPTRTYYTFDGWFTARTGGTQINGSETVTADVTYYAHWTQKTCTVTVNIKDVPVSGTATDHTFIGDVKLGSAGTYKATLSSPGAATAIITGVPQSDTSYDIYLGNDDTSVNVTPNGDTASATVNFYELKVTAGANGSASLAGTTIASGASSSNYYLPGTTGVTLGATADTDYVFLNWTGDTGKVTGLTATTAANTITTSATGEAAALTANFQKVAFTVKLTLNLDDKAKTALDAPGGDVTALTVVRTDGTADTATHTLTYNSTDSKWVVSGLKTGTTYKITVTTRTGTYDAITNLTTDKNDGVINLYSLNVAAGTYGNVTNKPYVTNDSTKPTKAVVLKGTSVPLAANPDNNGWTVTGWVEQGKATAPAKMTVTTTAATFGSDYAAATAGTGVTLTPVYTFSTTVVTSYQGTAQNVTSVSVGGGSVGMPSPAGNYKITGLTPGTTYTVTVNGFASSVTFDEGEAGTNVPVTIYKISVNKQTAVNSETIDGTAFIAIGNTATSGSSVYLPIGAKTDTTHVVTVAAAKGTKYRLKTETGEHPWTAGTYVANQDATTTTVKTPDAGMAADITITADFVRQYTASVSVSGASNSNTKAEFTGKGTAGTTIATGNKSATVDANTYVQATFTPGIGDTLKSWTFTGGELWTTYDKSGTGSKLTSGQTTSAKVVYFFPEDDNATLQADVVAAKYPVTVTVNLDNAAYADQDASNQVQVRIQDATKNQTYNLTKTANGVYTVNALPGNYKIYINGLDLSETVAATAAFDTEKALNFTAAEAEGKNEDGTAMSEDDKAAAQAKLTAEVNYYTLKVEKTFSDGGTSTAHFANHGTAATNTTGENAAKTKIVLAKKDAQIGMTVGATATNETGSTPFYRFDNWSVSPASGATITTNAAAGVFTLPTENDLKAKTDGTNFDITADHQITLTATFQRQFKVTVAKDGSVPVSVGVLVKKTEDTNYAAYTYVMVDDGSSADAHVNGTIPTGQYFKDWTVTSGKGTFNTGRTDKGYEKTADNAFYPAEDSTITLSFWTDAGINPASATFDKGSGTNTWDNTVKFTIRDAKDVTETFAFTGVSGSTVTPVLNTDYTKATADGVTTYTFKTDFLKTLTTAATHTLTIAYKLDDVDGDTGSHTNKVTPLSKTFTLTVKATAYTLTETKIKVKDSSGTLNVDDTADHGTAEYLSHKNPAIDPLDKLTLQWFYADTDPQERALTAAEIAGLAAATPTYPTGWTALTGVEDFTGTGTTYTVKPNYAGKGNNAIKGRYVFAVAKATSTGTGSVITNAIPVDYEAHITVKKDDTTVGSATGYTVRLWPTDGGTFAAATAIQTTYNTTNKTFDTAASALTGGKSYHVYVTTVEGGTAYQKVDGITITGTGNTATVNYYGVRAVTTDLKHAMNGSNSMGEDFTTVAAPNTQFAVKGGAANGEAVASGTGVVSGTVVTATPSKAWATDHDYKWNWSAQAQDNKNDGTNAAPTLTYGTEGQASGAATKDYTVTETNWIGGQMEQRTYPVTGDLKSLSGTGVLDTATLTSGAFSFTGSIDHGKTAPATVTFTGVPRNVVGGAVGEHYTISATPGDATTIIGYKAPAATAAEWTANPVSNAGDVTVSPTAYQNRFTIFVEATQKELVVTDTHGTVADPGTGTTETDDRTEAKATGKGTAAMTHTDTGIFKNYTWSEKTVTITNNGNTPLEVTLVVSKGGTTVYDGTQTLTGDDKILVDGGVTIGGLGQLGTGGKVTLTEKGTTGNSMSFTLTASTDLNAWDDTEYSFQFSSKDNRDNVTEKDGPTVTYNYKMVVDPVEITKVTAVKQATGEYKVTDFTIKEANGKDDLTVGTKTTNNAADPTSGDLIYTWYVAAWDDAVTLDKNTGEPKLGGVVLPVGQGAISDNGRTYTPTTADKGKALYLVVKGRTGSNAKSAAMTPNPEENDPVVLVPYQGVVQIHEDDVLMATDTRADDYVVELHRKDAPDGTAAIPMKWDGDKDAFVTNGDVLWARDPDWAADSGTEPTAWEYEVWASRVPGAGKATLQNTGLVINVDNKDNDHIVDYYKVLIGETNVNQGIYEGKLADLTAGGIFLTKATLTQAKPEAKTTVDDLTVAAGGYVQKGNDVTFTYDNWTKDYKMTWSGAISDATNNGPADVSVHRAYSAKETQTVETTLSLKTYPVRVTVTGTVGKVDVITMTLGGNTFTTATTGGIVGIGSTGLAEVAIGSNPTFQLPKAEGYTTVATVTDDAVETWSCTYGANTEDVTGAGTANITVNVTGIATQDTYNINLLGAGYAMSVTDNVPTGVDDTSGEGSVTATSSIPDGGTDVVNNSTRADHTIHLNYNYARLADPDTDKPQKVILTLKNEGNDDIRTITGVSVNELAKQNITAATLGTDTLAPGASTTLELTIDPGLAVGSTIHYQAEFNFTGGGKTAKVTYELTAVVDPLPFTAVSTKAGTTEGTHTVNEYTVQPAPEGADAVKDTTISPAGADKKTGLTHGTDYAYKWVRTAMDVTLTNADVTWNNGTVTLPNTATDCNGDGYNTPTYTPNDADEGQKLYLVVYAKAGTVNATGAAISPAITTGYTGTIQIKEDPADPDTSDPVKGANDPGYQVWFIPAGGTDANKVEATWNNKTDNTAGYTATLDPNVASYTVKVSRAKGWTDDADMVPLTGVTITNDHRTDKAIYYTVSSKPFEPKAYQTDTKNTGETFQDADRAVTMTLEGEPLTTDTPVLANQTVKAKSTNGWGQDYKLFWQTDKVGTNVSITTDTVDTTKQQNSDTAKGDNAFSKQITDTTWIGGRLDQNTYTVTGNIKNPTGKTGGEVSKVEMVGGSQNRTYTTDITNASAISANNSISVGSDGIQGNNGDTVKITVVKGEYTITAYEGTETVITEVTIGADGVVTTEKNPNNPVTWANRNTAAMTGDEKVAQAGRVFNIYLEGQALSLSVADGHTDHEATSTILANNNQAKHTQVYYFNGVDTTAIPLTLTNGSNRQMTVTGAVTKVTSLTGVDFDAGTGLGSPLGADKVTVTGVPTAGTVIAAGDTASGGSLSVAADAANTDDGIYIFQFTSSGTDTSGNTVTGPTVYYVFDLTVEPLPIMEVDAAQDATTKVMSLVDADGAAHGLDHVRVDDDGKTTTTPVAASTKSITDNDVSFIWFYADSADLTKDNFELSGGTVQPKAGVSATKKADGKTCTPDAAEEGKFFYLIAYQKSATCNASDFAVSQAIYAQVTVSVKAYQTNTANPVPVTEAFNVVGTLGEGDGAIVQKAQNGRFAVNGNDPKKISFTAIQADNVDPAKAAWYFTGWGDTAANFSSTTALTTEYTVTKQDTVIGYYDQLPQLEKDQGYSLVESDEENNRTFTYHPYNGSKHVVVAIAPKAGSSFKSDPTAELMWLDDNTWEKVANTVGGTIGEDGNYVLKNDWIIKNLQLNGLAAGEYTITFYDLDKGEYKVEGGKPVRKDDGTGYAGYDRTITFRVTGGEVDVIARVKNDAPEGSAAEYHGTVKMTNNAGASNGPGTSATLRTSGGSVTITAAPAAGYKFDKWKLITGTGKITETAPGVANFEPYEMGCVVEASFVAADFTVANKKALVIYGNSDFETGSDTSVAATAPEAAGTTFTYAVVNTADQPGWLELDPDTGVFSFKAGAKVDTNVQSSTTGSYTAVDNEVVLTVRITSNAGKTKDVTYTIDVEPGTLTVNHDAAEDTAEKRGTAYIAANIAAGRPVAVADEVNNVPLYNETVLKQLFAYTNVTDQANTVIDATGHAGDATKNDSGAYDNGTWTVDPTRFQGTDAPSTYKFTFTYKPDSATEKWNYTAGETNMTLTIAKPPVGAEFADIIGNFADVENVLKPGHWTNSDDSDYSLVAKPEGYDGTSGKAPVEMDYTDNTFRKNETITYLDEEPRYTVKLKSVDAAIHGTTFTTDELVGFRLATGSAYPTFTGGRFASTDGEKTFTLELAPVNGSVWVGEHHAKFTLTGYSTAELAQEGGTPNVTATYELTVKVLPKVITSVDVKVLDPETTPDSVTGTTESGTVDNKTPDGKGNVPITDVDVTWGPEDGPDDKHTNVKVDVEIDPNYKYAEDDNTTPDTNEDITKHTETTVKETLPDSTVTNRAIPDPTVTRDGTDGEHLIHIDQDIPYLMHADVNDGDATDTTGPKVDDRRTVSVQQGAKDLGSYTIDLDAFGADLYDVEWTVAQDSITADAEGGIGAVLGTLPTGFNLTAGGKRSVVLDLSAADTSKPGNNYTLTLVARGKAKATDPDEARTIQSTYVFQLNIRSASVPQPPEPECPCKVLYYVGTHGVTADATIEDVSEKNRPSKVPGVTALDGYVFRGWSLTNPATLKDGEKLTLVDPKTVEAKGETMTFYAVIVERPFHEHYVIGYPNGNFGPADDITRGSVATIIARAILPDFVEGSNYGNPGNYTDVSGHWAESAIAYCSKFGVFKGYTDGTFRPDQPITRQEFATVIARLDGELTAKDIPFDDIDEAGAWALNGIYTSYEKGWVNGYTDGTFKPLNNIRRDEAVKIFNAYLNRGVDADGLSDLHEYVHSGTASNVTGNGTDEYMTWSDVPKDHWAYYEIVEAANDHEFTPDFDAPLGYTLPEHWEKCWIDARWRYSDNAAADVH